MQLTIEKKVETKEYLTVPDGCYKEGSNYYYKIAGDVCLMVITKSMFREGRIEILTPSKHSDMIKDALEGTPISHGEFYAAYCEVHNAQAEVLSISILFKTA